MCWAKRLGMVVCQLIFTAYFYTGFQHGILIFHNRIICYLALCPYWQRAEIGLRRVNLMILFVRNEPPKLESAALLLAWGHSPSIKIKSLLESKLSDRLFIFILVSLLINNLRNLTRSYCSSTFTNRKS